MHIILSSDESGSFRIAGSKSGETIKACNWRGNLNTTQGMSANTIIVLYAKKEN